ANARNTTGAALRQRPRDKARCARRVGEPIRERLSLRGEERPACAHGVGGLGARPPTLPVVPKDGEGSTKAICCLRAESCNLAWCELNYERPIRWQGSNTSPTPALLQRTLPPWPKPEPNLCPPYAKSKVLTGRPPNGAGKAGKVG